MTSDDLPARLLELGVRVGDEWRARGRDERAFPEIAQRALEESALAGAYDIDALIGAVLSADPLPSQNNETESFGQPPVTVYRGEGFLVEILFWIDGLVSIHQHSFNGAFSVFAGSSVHTRYRFTANTRISSAMIFGDLAFASAELLARGDIRAIEAGSELIHATFHLDSPTVTVVVRTDADPESGPQYDYRPPSLALDPSCSRPTLAKHLQLLRMLHRTDVASYWRSVDLLLRRSDWFAAYRILEQGYLLFDGDDARSRLFALARAGAGEGIDTLLPVLEESAIRRGVVARRNAERDEEARLFLALLLTVPNRAAILDLVAMRHPAEAAEDVVLRCLRKLGFDDDALVLSRILVSGESSREGLRARLARDNYRFDNDYAMLKAVRTLRDVPGLRALFAEG